MRLRDVILGARFLDATTLAQAEAHAAQTQTSLAHVLVAFNVVDGRKLARLLSRALHFELIDVAAVELHPRLLEVVPRDVAERLRVLPIGVQPGQGGDRLFLAMSDPSDDAAIEQVEKATGFVVDPLVCDDAALQRSFAAHYPDVDAEAPVLVGDLVGGDHDYLTESTAEALQLLQAVRQNDAPHRATSLALGEATREGMTRPRAVSMALGEIATAVHTRPGFFDATREHSRAFVDDEPTLAHDEPLFGGSDEVDTEAPTLRRSRSPDTDPTVKTRAPRPSQRVIVATHQTDRRLHQELERLIENIEVVLDDDVAACGAAHDQLALVLIEPAVKSALLRAMLDLEEAAARPKIVVVGGAPAFAVLAFIDQHLQVQDDPRATAFAIVAALRKIGVAV